PQHALSPCRSWSGSLWRGWFTLVPVGAVWSVCQMEALLQPSVLLLDFGWRFLLVCMLWLLMGGCVYAMKRYLQRQVDSPQKMQQEVMSQQTRKPILWASRARTPGQHLPLALALTDSLLLCVLQESLLDPCVPHIQALLSTLESVSHTLEEADISSEATQEEVTVAEKVKLLMLYLQQRTRSLRRLVQVQQDLEASMKDLLERLAELWAQLEELHTGVTLSKEGSRGHRDLASARTEAQSVVADLCLYRIRLEHCQDHLNENTQLLQELTWSHTHSSVNSSSSCEFVWTELLLQSNIEQFDKVQESFLSLEHQTSTFQAHLEGLGGGTQEGCSGPLSHTRQNSVSSASPQSSPSLLNGRHSDVSVERCGSSPTSTSVSSLDGDTDARLSLCERSALQFSTTMGRFHRSGKRKK
ncbi:hypothetical protein LDENG_00126430, partial [Lucifuga dentata]